MRGLITYKYICLLLCAGLLGTAQGQWWRRRYEDSDEKEKSDEQQTTTRPGGHRQRQGDSMSREDALRIYGEHCDKWYRGDRDLCASRVQAFCDRGSNNDVCKAKRVVERLGDANNPSPSLSRQSDDSTKSESGSDSGQSEAESHDLAMRRRQVPLPDPVKCPVKCLVSNNNSKSASENRGNNSGGQGGQGGGQGGQGRHGLWRKADSGKLHDAQTKLNRIAARKAQMSNSQRSLWRRKRPQWSIRKDTAKKQRSELDVNEKNDAVYFQGDLDVTEEQLDAIVESIEEAAGSGKRKKRKVGARPIYELWDKMPISYSFASSVPYSTKIVIRKAIAAWESETCVRWKENGPNTDRIEFVGGAGCSSYVGMIGGTQQISIATPGCNYLGIVAHELGHSLGFFHEQARADQSRHVEVMYDNINPLRFNNFLPVDDREVDYEGYNYDFGSVMHYDPYGFALISTQETIRSLDPYYQTTMGQRQGPSFVDVAQINAAYCRYGTLFRIYGTFLLFYLSAHT